MARCPYCGQRVEAGARFCGECGRHLLGADFDPGIRTPQGRGRRMVFILLGLSLSLACGGCLLFLVLSPMMDDFPVDLSQYLPESEGPNLVEVIEPARTSTGFDQVWIEHNVISGDDNYMVVHLQFEVEQAQAQRVTLTALAWQADDSPMAASEPAYTVAEQAGLVELAEVELAPSTVWQDYQLWFPYRALLVGDGHYLTVSLEDTETGTILDAIRTEPFYVE